MTGSTSRRYRLGVDTGGTFTDSVLVDEVTGRIETAKVPSTPADPSRGFLNAVRRILGDSNVAPNQVTYLVHGTTVATNAIIEGKVARTGFVTTAGFRDMLEIARQIRPSLYDLHFEKPRPIAPRYLCFGVTERLDARGNVLTALDEASVREAARALREERVEAVAICLLHSYANSDHEQRVSEILEEVCPGVLISVSSTLVPEFREYFRASTTVVNASIRPVVSRYLSAIEREVRGDGLDAELLVMQSNGGVYTFEVAAERPVFMVESGPAAGVIAAANIGAAVGHPNVISLDMGGTTAKAALILDGTPRVTKDYEVGAQARSDMGAGRGSGYPIRTPVIDLVEIGAGGGSIAWVDSGGVLRVGPRSAGADPGPACYGQGGVEPTITDANLVLGRLNADYFLGGEIRLDQELATRAIRERCAAPLGLSVEEAAYGIVEIANAAMVNALRLVSVQRGYDPRDFVLVGFGGAGPVHANRLAHESEIPITVIPPSPGTASALGLLVTNLRHEYSVTLRRRADLMHATELEAAFRELEGQGRKALLRERVPGERIGFERSAEMRYVGQGYELSVGLLSHPIDAAEAAALVERFHEIHEQTYGHRAPNEPVEIVNLRVTAVGTITNPAAKELPRGGDVSVAVKGSRPVYFAECGGFTQCPIYERSRLGAEDSVHGPAVIEEVDSTTVVHPGTTATVHRSGSLILR